MANETIPQLPTTSSATMSDIIACVQGYDGTLGSGLTVQETLHQVFELFSMSMVLTSTNNPNGVIAGTIYQFCWDTANAILYICTTAGSSSSAIWNKVIKLTGSGGVTISQAGNEILISASPSGITWTNITLNTFQMLTNSAYQADSSSLINFSLPITSSFGDSLWVGGLGAGGWSIVQTANQQVISGIHHTTIGATGTVSSTNQYDGIQLYCVTPNLVWKTISSPQGTLTFV